MNNHIKSRVLIFDLETGGVNAFKADLGMVLCFGYKWLGEKTTRIIKVNDFPDWFKVGRGVNDKPAIQEALKIMEEAEVLIAHYGERFDRRFFQGRCAIHDLMPPHPVKLRDTWRVARTAFAFSSNRLGNLAETFDLKYKKHQKSRDEWPGWWLRAMAGSDKDINQMAKYCMKDVQATEDLYLRIRKYDYLHTMLGMDREACRLCNGSMESRGIIRLAGGMYRKLRCKDCGATRRDTKRV